MPPSNERWSGRLGFILATIGSAIGLGSIWKFPYEVGTNGGGVFVAFYLAGLLLIVLPLVLVEFAAGRSGRADAAGSLAAVALEWHTSRRWGLIGSLGIVTGFLILTFYSVIGGWTVAYSVDAARAALPGSDAQEVRRHFETLLASPVKMAFHHAVFMGLTALIVGRGIARGIEAANKVLMPILIALMLMLAIYSVTIGDVARTTRFLFQIDPAQVTARAALEALGLGFFSIGVGLGLMITYAAYADAKIDLAEVAWVTVAADTAVCFASGFAIFPIVFANGLDPASGPGLLFVTLPLALAAMPYGNFASVAFFVLLFVAALASAVSLLELSVAWAMRRCGWARVPATASVAVVAWVIGLATVFSFNLWVAWFPLSGLRGFETATIFDLVDHLTSNILLPAGGFALSMLAGWVLPERWLGQELGIGRCISTILRLLLRYLAPAAIAVATVAPNFV
ncbi:MAG TPA: sodium-dependent transporter [Xanthobacteraceae bacterium]|jgi:NSS family neurotransmitter:Na+ symporter